MGKKIIGTDEAAEMLGITKVHLMRLCKNKGLPHYKPCGGKVYFIKQELIKWITGKEETEESV